MDYAPSITITAAPVAVGLGAFAAILLADGTEDLSWVRFTIAAIVFLAISGGGAYVAARWNLARFERRLADDDAAFRQRLAAEDAAHRKAVVAAFEADVERITGRPFPTDPATEK